VLARAGRIHQSSLPYWAVLTRRECVNVIEVAYGTGRRVRIEEATPFKARPAVFAITANSNHTYPVFSRQTLTLQTDTSETTLPAAIIRDESTPAIGIKNRYWRCEVVEFAVGDNRNRPQCRLKWSHPQQEGPSCINLHPAASTFPLSVVTALADSEGGVVASSIIGCLRAHHHWSPSETITGTRQRYLNVFVFSG